MVGGAISCPPRSDSAREFSTYSTLPLSPNHKTAALARRPDSFALTKPSSLSRATRPVPSDAPSTKFGYHPRGQPRSLTTPLPPI